MKNVAIINEFSVEAIKDALQKLDSFDNLKVNGLNAFQLSELSAIDPELFSQVGEKIKADRWFPYAGAWSDSDELSETALIKSCLYSVRYFLDNFGKKYRVFHGAKIYNNLFPQIVYSSLFDAVILKSETETKWIHAEDGFRTLSIFSDTVDVNDLDDCFISENEFISYEELAENLFNGALDLDVLYLPSGTVGCTEAEKTLVESEKYAVLNSKNETAKIREAWLSYLGGDTETALSLAESILGSNSPDESCFEIHGDGVKISEIKLAEDNSGDVVIRVTENEGREKSAYLMCDRLNAGFRFEITPYEVITFRILADGNVEEIYICE